MDGRKQKSMQWPKSQRRPLETRERFELDLQKQMLSILFAAFCRCSLVVACVEFLIVFGVFSREALDKKYL
jgi:hypothetical protein